MIVFTDFRRRILDHDHKNYYTKKPYILDPYLWLWIRVGYGQEI
jgi:hypothetical protein